MDHFRVDFEDPLRDDFRDTFGVAFRDNFWDDFFLFFHPKNIVTHV